MRKSLIGLALLLGSGLWMVGCGDDGGCPEGQASCDGVCIDAIEPTLTSIQERVFTPTCGFSSCHDDDLPASELDLSSVSASAMNLIDVNSVQVPTKLRVAPDDSAASYLVNKIQGVGMAAGTTQMPQNDQGLVLCQPKVDAILAWIDDGAPSN
jgi:hypothetical protein